jgi:hypothetical protein
MVVEQLGQLLAIVSANANARLKRQAKWQG